MKSSSRSIAFFLALVVFGGLLWLAVYAYQEGFTKKWRKLIVEEFESHDLIITFDTLTIDPFQGLVANKVVLLDHETHQEVASVSKARLDIDLPKLIREERFLQRIELESANLSLPYDREDPESEILELQNLDATIVFPNGRIEIAHAKADFYGLHLHLTGTLLSPESESNMSWQREKIQAAHAHLEKLAKHLAVLEFDKARPPTLDMLVSGDLAEASSLKLTAKLEGANLRYADFEARSFLAKAIITNQEVALSNLTLTDSDERRLDITGQFPLASGEQATIALNSSMDLYALLTNVLPEHPLWAWITSITTPTLAMQGSLQIGDAWDWSKPPVDLVGHFGSDQFSIGDEPFRAVSGDFHIEGPRVIVRNLILEHDHGKSEGKFVSTPEEGLRYDFTVGMDPTLLGQLPLTESFEMLLDKWEFPPNSGVTVTVSGERKSQDAASWDHQGHAELTECRYGTAEIEKLALDFQLNPHAYHFSNIQLKVAPDAERRYSGGSVRARRISISAQDQLTMLTGVEGTIDPGQIVRPFSQKVADRIDKFRFSRPPEVKIPRGTIDPNGVAQTNLQLEVKATGSMTTEVLGKPVPFDEPRFGLHFQQQNVVARVDHAGLFQGTLVGNADLRDLDSKRTYSAKIELDQLDFQSLASVYFPEHRADGQLTGEFSWRGEDTALEAMDGKGEVRLLNSENMEVPVLGPLSELLKLVIGKTKISHSTIRELGTSFTIKESKLSLNDLSADLIDYRIDGNGSVHLPTEEVELEVSLHNQSGAAAIVNVLYEIFGTYKCTGTLGKPKWTMVNRFKPNEVLKVIEGIGDPNKPLKLDPDKLLELAPRDLLKDLFSRDSKKD